MAESKSSKQQKALEIIKKLRFATKKMQEPASLTIVRQYGRDPFLILISCLLSLRAKDTASLPASQRLFSFIKTPQELLDMPLAEIEKIIFSVGFYKNKAQQLKSVSHELITRFNGIVPSTRQELMSIKGVGPKTANLVLAVGFEQPAICVDIHVHRISNRLGLIQTKTPEETEAVLCDLLPQEYWAEFNALLVMWGQNVCVPVSPKCLTCPIRPLCERVGVTRSR